MNITFRVDASNKIGTGHVMRCLTLANFLKEKGAKAAFICAETEGNLIDYIRNEGYKVYNIHKCSDFLQDAKYTIEILQGQEVDLLIIDHYQIDLIWENSVRGTIKDIKIMVIDDLANRSHDCDLLLDQNYFKDFEKRYDGLVSVNRRKLLGPKYLLLRPEFYQEDITGKNNEMKDILVFYGGPDPTNETVKVLEALDAIDLSLNIHVVVGLSNVHKDQIKEICKKRNYHFYIQINYLSQLMKKADLSLGAGGVTMWERCYLGLPSIVTIVADNQRESTEGAVDFGAVWSLGWHEGVKVSDLVDIMNRVLENPEELKDMSNRAKQLMQSELRYKTHPVIEAILEVSES